MMEGLCFYCSCLVLLILTTNNVAAGASRLSQQPKTIIKTIQSEDGDVIDCVHIYHQPAFDHPLLKDHTIKKKPSNHPQGFLGNDNNSSYGKNNKQITQVWQLSGECPEGTVPIRRTDRRKNSIVGKKARNVTTKLPDPNDYSGGGPHGHEYAVLHFSDQKYYGAKAVISAWNPLVEGAGEFSLSQMWLIAGSDSTVDTIEVGWHVFPQIYGGDTRTRLFVFWTNDNYQGPPCYNLDCPGFVQTSNQMLIGGIIANPSEVTLLVWKDASKKVWWLEYNDNTVGYWPFELFSALQDSASQVEYGGEIINSNTNGVHTATQMGSGEFAEAGTGKASYFKNIEVVNDVNALVPPTSMQTIVSNEKCYDIIPGKDDQSGNFFYYGGPGKNPNCP